MISLSRGWPFATAAAVSLGCTSVAEPLEPPPGRRVANLAIVDVAVLDLAANRLVANQTILVENGTITAIGATESVAVPAGTETIAAHGAVAMAPLVDAHTHSLVRDRLRYLGFGIGTVRVMWGTPDQQSLARAIAAGDSIGPAMVLASPGHDGQPPSWPLTRFVLTPDQAGPAVAQVAAEGWSFLKVYNRLSVDAYRAIMIEARSRGIPVVGHVPFAVDLHLALSLGQRSIEHLTGYDVALTGRPAPNPLSWTAVDPRAMPALAVETAQAGTWNCPTLVVTDALAKANWPTQAAAVMTGRRAMVKALFDAGAPLLIGTDSGIDIVTAGSSLIDEIAEFVQAGISAPIALRIATIDAAVFLGRADRAGAIALERPADILLLAGDPRRDLEVLRRPTGLLIGGRLFTRDDLAVLRGGR